MPGRRKTQGSTRSITFDTVVLESLDETAQSLAMGRSVLVNAICRHWLEDFEMPKTSAEPNP